MPTKANRFSLSVFQHVQIQTMQLDQYESMFNIVQLKDYIGGINYGCENGSIEIKQTFYYQKCGSCKSVQKCENMYSDKNSRIRARGIFKYSQKIEWEFVTEHNDSQISCCCILSAASVFVFSSNQTQNSPETLVLPVVLSLFSVHL